MENRQGGIRLPENELRAGRHYLSRYGARRTGSDRPGDGQGNGALFALRDRIRPGAAALIETLRAQGVNASCLAER